VQRATASAFGHDSSAPTIARRTRGSETSERESARIASCASGLFQRASTPTASARIV
jgi:hypothetical protein